MPRICVDYKVTSDGAVEIQNCDYPDGIHREEVYDALEAAANDMLRIMAEDPLR